MADDRKKPTSKTAMPLSSVSFDDMTWNKTGSWRHVRPFYDPGTPPCITGCPAGEDIQGYIALAKEEKFEEAVRLIWESNPFPAICGRVCYHPCMTRCLRDQFDEAVFIPAIERFLGDYAISERLKDTPPSTRRDERIAIVGGGPAGLSCAYFLAKRGCRVTVFEAKSELGGVLRYGIPPYRLPKDVLDAELERFLDLGIEMKPNTTIGKDVPVEALSDYDAFFLGIGLQRSRALGLPHEDAGGVMAGLDFLETVNTGRDVDVGRRAVVVGGGNTAMDVARTARRLGAEVTVVYRRTRQEMPAMEEEVGEAEREGVTLRFLGAPAEIVPENGRLRSVRFQEMTLAEPDASGRRRPVPKQGSFFALPLDTLLVATGELPDAQPFDSIVALENGLIVTDDTGRTQHGRGFAGGDVVTGASTVVNAIARGRAAAGLIAAELSGGRFDPRTDKKVVKFADLNTAYFEHKVRAAMRRLPDIPPTAPFGEVNLGLTRRELREELDRCFSCGVCDACDNCWLFCPDVAISREDGVYTIDYDYCKGCLICARECPRGVIATQNEGT